MDRSSDVFIVSQHRRINNAKTKSLEIMLLRVRQDVI